MLFLKNRVPSPAVRSCVPAPRSARHRVCFAGVHSCPETPARLWLATRLSRSPVAWTELIHASHLQFTGILLSGHQHGSPPFNVAGPLISCLTFGVHSTLLPSPFLDRPGPL